MLHHRAACSNHQPCDLDWKSQQAAAWAKYDGRDVISDGAPIKGVSCQGSRNDDISRTKELERANRRQVDKHEEELIDNEILDLYVWH